MKGVSARGVRRFVVGVSTVFLLLALAPTAGASQTVGEDFNTSGGACGTPLSDPYMAVQTGSPGNAYAAPFDGVLTSWKANTNAWGTATLKVVRLGSGVSFTVLAQDGPRASGPTSYPIRIPVRQGDVLGLFFPAQSQCPGGGPAPSTYSYGTVAGDVAPGPGSFGLTAQSFKFPVTAQIEHDADGDGYGDETQDGCPSVASTQGPCPLPTVLGRTLQPILSSCSNETMVATGPPEYPFSAPADGVITSWSYQAPASLSGMLKLSVLRPLGASDYRSVADSASETPVANTLSTFPTRIPVRQGDRIGMKPNGVPCTANVGTGSHLWIAGDVAPGSSATFPNASSRGLDISAVEEADADGDGYGDTSQDLCPTDATTQGACRTTTPPPPDDDTAACDKAKKKLEKAKAKLKKLKKADASAKKVKGAKAKVKKAKDAVKKAC